MILLPRKKTQSFESNKKYVQYVQTPIYRNINNCKKVKLIKKV